MEEVFINYYGRRNKGYAEFFGRVLCGIASGYAFLILFVLALNVSNMTAGHIGQIGEWVSVSFPIPLTPHRIALWNTKVETLELAKIIVSFLLFAIVSAISVVVFLQIENLYNVFFILGLEFLPIPIIGKYLMAQGFVLYFVIFVIGVCLICYSAALRTFLKLRNKPEDLTFRHFKHRYGYL